MALLYARPSNSRPAVLVTCDAARCNTARPDRQYRCIGRSVDNPGELVQGSCEIQIAEAGNIRFSRHEPGGDGCPLASVGPRSRRSRSLRCVLTNSSTISTVPSELPSSTKTTSLPNE